MKNILCAIFSILCGIYCLCNGKTPILGIIGGVGCFVVAILNIVLGVIIIKDTREYNRRLKEYERIYKE